MTPVSGIQPTREAEPGFNAANLEKRNILRELGQSAKAVWTVVRDTDAQPALFTVFRTFPVFDIMKYATERSPILSDPRFIDLYERGVMPDLSESGMKKMAELPEGSFGRAFAEFCAAWELGDTHLNYLLPPDNERRYLIYRTALFHDLFHFMTGYFHPTVMGEIEVDAFQYAQSGLVNHPLFMIGGAGNILLKETRRAPEAVRRAREAFRLGEQAKSILLTEWTDLWAMPEQEVRDLFGLSNRRGYLPGDAMN